MHYTIIPIKSLKDGKKRLESFLSPSERKKLVLALLKDVLTAATASRLSDHILLVTNDSEIIEFAIKWNLPKLKFLREPSAKGTHHAVQFALNWCISESASSILIIPADIPLITARDVDDIIELGMSENSIILVPSQRRDGTNALFLKTSDLIEVWYGVNSFQKNLDTISQHEIRSQILESPTFALDIDLKEDLVQLLTHKTDSLSHQFVKNLMSKN